MTGNDDISRCPVLSISHGLCPGSPFTPEDFDFLKFGTHGDTVERTNQLLEQQLVVSKLFDFIPELPAATNGDHGFNDSVALNQTIFTTTHDSISSVWRDVLSYSRVVNFPLSPAEEQKLKEANDFITNEANVKAYTEGYDKWNEKCDALNSVKIPGEAATGNSPRGTCRLY